MVGLDAAGKTTALYKLKFPAINQVDWLHFLGINVETITYKDINFIALDFRGRDKIQALSHHYYHNTNVIVFVMDSNDRDRFPEVKEEIWRMMAEEELKDALFLVMANKQDLPNAMSVNEITEKLEMNKLRDRKWYVQGTCATTGEGLYEGLSWLQSTLTQREVKKAVVKPVKEVVKSEITPLSSDKPAKKPVTSSWWGMISSYFKISPGPVS